MKLCIYYLLNSYIYRIYTSSSLKRAFAGFRFNLIINIYCLKLSYDILLVTGYREDVAVFTYVANLVVVASISTEAQSRDVQQAFTMRKTVVSTDTGELTELIKHKYNGLVITTKNDLSFKL